MPIPGTRHCCDEGVVDVVSALNGKKGMVTTASCQGDPGQEAWVRIDGKGAVAFLSFAAERIYQALCADPLGSHGLAVTAGPYGVQLHWHPDEYEKAVALAREFTGI